jgi:hypothetical protein
MFLTAVARVDTRALFANETGVFRTELSPLEGGGAGTLLYFLFGLALLSQGRYITLNTRWYLQKVPVSRSMAGNWAIYSLSFLGLIVLIVSVLPTNYSLGLLSVLGYLLDLVLGVLFFITNIILLLFGLLLSLPFLLFRADPPIELPPIETPPPVEPPPPPALTESTGFPWLDLLKSLLFWSIFLGVVGYSIAQYLRQHEEILQRLRKIPGWAILASFWRWLTGVFGGFNRRVSTLIQAGRTRSRSPRESMNLESLRRFMSLRGLSPRQRVLFYYQALLRRGDETGLPREKSQTPDEYAERLERSLPTVKDDILALTESFSEARYARHPVESEDANQVKTYWEHIRRVFRGRRG